MVWNPENCSEADVVCPQPCPPATSDEIDSSTISQTFFPDAMLPCSTYPDSFIDHTGDCSEFLKNTSECAKEKDVISQTMQRIGENVNNDTNGNESCSLTIEISSVLDNAHSHVTNDNVEINFCELNKEHSIKKSRTRQDSTESYDTVDSSSSGEIFSSSYTDTVGSVESTTFLLKPSSDSEGEATLTDVKKQERYTYNVCNMSCSSSEVLNETESDEEMAKSELSSEEPDESQALMESCVQSQTEGNQEEEETKKSDDFVPHSLVPIHENQVISFLEEEVQPIDYIKITNNVISVDESFLFHSNTSLWDLETSAKDTRAVTMQNLHERSSFLDLTEVSKIGKACQKALLYLKDDINFGSVASINTIANKQFEKDPTQSLSLLSGDKAVDVVKSNRHMSNLLALSLSLTLLYIAIGSVRNLQSSINHEGGVGVLSMATNSIGYTAGSLFSASVVLNFQPRKCIIVNLIPNLLYVAANIYPALWVMIPISFLQGLANSVIWNAVSTYVTFLSRGRTQKTGEATDQVSSRYFGILCLTYQSHLIIGNLIASLVLMPGGGSGSSKSSNETSPFYAPNITDLASSSLVVTEDHTAESLSISGMKESHTNVSGITGSRLSVCGAKFCNLFEEEGAGGFAVSNEIKYLLFGIYMGCILISLLIALFWLEPLDGRLFMSSVKPLQKLKSQLKSLMLFFGDIKFILLVPLLMYSVIQFGFVTAEFTKAFVTCSLGIHMVGYTMICFGICGGISSYLSGLLTKFTGRIPFFIFAGITNLVLLIFMTQWQPSGDSLLPFFVIMGAWGISDGIWISSVSSLMGIIFPQKYEEAYAGLRIVQGVGPSIAFGYSSSLCMETKIYITVTLCVVSLTLYLLMEGLLKRKGRKSSIKFKQTSV